MMMPCYRESHGKRNPDLVGLAAKHSPSTAITIALLNFWTQNINQESASGARMHDCHVYNFQRRTDYVWKCLKDFFI
jgi:hypothetical protein